MSLMDRLKGLFQRPDVPKEALESYRDAANERELLRSLEDRRARNEIELREREDQILDSEGGLEPEKERIRKGGLTPTQKRILLGRIARAETAQRRVEDEAAIYARNIAVVDNLIATIKEMQAMDLGGVTENTADELFDKRKTRTEAYQLGLIAGDAAGARVSAVIPGDGESLDDLEKRIFEEARDEDEEPPEGMHA